MSRSQEQKKQAMLHGAQRFGKGLWTLHHQFLSRGLLLGARGKAMEICSIVFDFNSTYVHKNQRSVFWNGLFHMSSASRGLSVIREAPTWVEMPNILFLSLA